MVSRQRMWAALPRLMAGQTGAAMAWNAAALVATALVGAGLVHLLAYHTPIGLPLGPQWGAQALALLAHCSLLVPFGVIVAIAALAPLLALREVLRLQRLHAALARLLPAPLTRRGMPATPPFRGEPAARSPWRLVCFIAVLLGAQVALSELAALFCPMQISMVMDGAPMSMAIPPALPLGPLHLIVAALLALLLWRIERRLTHLRTAVAQQMHLLSAIRTGAGVRPPIHHSTCLPLGWSDPALFARPPPLAA